MTATPMLIHPEYPVLSNLLVSLGLVGVMIWLSLLGRRAGDRHLAIAGTEDQGHGLIESAILTLDIENPRYGLIRIDNADRLLRAVLDGMK